MQNLNHSNEMRGPHDVRGVVKAALLGVSIFIAMLSVETQLIARADQWNTHDLGPPIVGRLYSPFESLRWMQEVDVQFNLMGMLRGRGITAGANESAWARNAFATERMRLPFEALAAFIGFAVAASLWTKPRRTSGLYGNAQWASSRDLQQSQLSQARNGIVLGQDVRSKNLLIHDGQEAVLAIGPPGCGKSDGIAVPTLLRTWTQSALVFDPAGELRDRTLVARKQFSKVLVFDPRDPQTACFNPLGNLTVDDIDAIQTILASYMFDKDISEMQASTQFFVTSALELGVAIIARAIELDRATFAGAADLYYGGAWDSDDKFFKSLLTSQSAYVAETASKFNRMDAELRSSILGTLTRYLSIFRSADIARATRASDFTAATLRRESTTLYLIVRERDQAALNPLVRMMLTRLLDDLTQAIPSSTEQSVLALLDEFPLLRAPIIEQKLATMRKFRIRPVLLAQTISQLKSYYGQHESVTGLCDVRVFFSTLDLETQELASKTCGETTVWSESTSRNIGERGSSLSHQEIGRALLLPSQLGSLGKNRIVIAKKGEAPILATPVASYKDKRFNVGNARSRTVRS